MAAHLLHPTVHCVREVWMNIWLWIVIRVISVRILLVWWVESDRWAVWHSDKLIVKGLSDLIKFLFHFLLAHIFSLFLAHQCRIRLIEPRTSIKKAPSHRIALPTIALTTRKLTTVRMAHVMCLALNSFRLLAAIHIQRDLHWITKVSCGPVARKLGTAHESDSHRVQQLPLFSS